MIFTAYKLHVYVEPGITQRIFQNHEKRSFPSHSVSLNANTMLHINCLFRVLYARTPAINITFNVRVLRFTLAALCGVGEQRLFNANRTVVEVDLASGAHMAWK